MMMVMMVLMVLVVLMMMVVMISLDNWLSFNPKSERSNSSPVLETALDCTEYRYCYPPPPLLPPPFSPSPPPPPPPPRQRTRAEFNRCVYAPPAPMGQVPQSSFPRDGHPPPPPPPPSSSFSS